MKIRLDGGGCLFLALLLLTLPLPWVVASLSAAAFHELCHILALVLMHKQIDGVNIGMRGTKILTAPMDAKEELLCAAAGPMGSLFLLLFLRQLPRLALCAGVQGLFNLLPLYPLDGGRILQSIKNMHSTR